MTPPPVAGAAARSGRPALRALAAVLVCVLAVCGAIGWLYLLRDARALRAGPAIGDALPLQRLAGQDAQPVLRLLLAWVPAGLAAGLALGWTTGLPAAARAGVVGAVAIVLLFALGAMSDAVTASEPVWAHVAPQLGHGALWFAAAAMAAGAALTTATARRAQP